MIDSWIFGIVICKFGHQQEFCSVILFEVNKNAEIDFHRTFLSITLAICLRIKGSWEPPFDIKEVTEQ